MTEIEYKGKTYMLDGDAYIKYRSHINGFTARYPDNWIACPCKDSDGNSYTAWYYVSDYELEFIELDEIDYTNPHDIEDEYGNLV